jgi:hypothetical protein
MPAKPRWWIRIPEILPAIENLEAPWLDRAAIEQVFGLRRRRAIELLHTFGGFQVGRMFLVDRQEVLDQLQAISRGEEFRWERKRRRRLSEALSEARQYSQAARVKIPVIQPSPSLPAGVNIEPGRMVIEFQSVEDLLSKFYAVVQAAARDYVYFQHIIQNAGPRS